MKWEELPLADRAKLMAAAVKNGYTDIRSIKQAYANFQNQKQSTGNMYSKGGDTDDTYEPEVINPLDNLPEWKALEHIDFTAISDPEFTREKTGAGSIEYFSAEEPEGITYTNGYHRDHPMPGKDVILYNPDEVRKWNAHLMPYTNDIQRYLETGERPPHVLPNLEVTDQMAYGGNLFDKGGKKKSKGSSTVGERMSFIEQELVRRGVFPVQARAVAANVMVESGGNPQAYNKSSGARGLAQWLGSRKPKSWSMEDQLDYLAATCNKLGGNEWINKAAWKRFNETNDPAEAARLFRRYWERPEASSWYATDKYFGINSKNSYLSDDVNNLVWKMSNLQYNKPRTVTFTKEDQKLLDTSPLQFVKPDYDNEEESSKRAARQKELDNFANSIMLNEDLYKPSNVDNLAFLLNTLGGGTQQSPSDSYNWFTSLLSSSPKTTPEQQNNTALYQLFAPYSNGGHLYHGLNFAAYSKPNKFSDGGPYSDKFMEDYGYRWVPASEILLSDPYFNDIQQHNPNGTYAVDKNGLYIPASRIKKEWQDYVKGGDVNGPATGVDLPELVHGFDADDQHTVDIAKRLWGDNRFYAYRDLSDPNSGFFTETINQLDWDDADLALERFSPNNFISKMDTLTKHSTTPAVFANELTSMGRSRMRDGRLRAYTWPTFPGAPIFLDEKGRNFLDDYISEFAHTYQYNVNDDDIQDLNLVGESGTVPVYVDGTYYSVPYEDTYRIPGFTEYNAHKGGIEQFLRHYLFDDDNTYERSKDKLFDLVPRHVEFPYGYKPREYYVPFSKPNSVKALGGPLIQETNKFDDGGFYKLPEWKAWYRSMNTNIPYSNYEDAIDMDDSLALKIKKALDKGVSNCTLTVSQFFNPSRPIARARTIVSDPIANGFYEVDEDHVVPGTMVIASHPDMKDDDPNQKYHTMIVSGFAPQDDVYEFRDGTLHEVKKGEPFVNYSRGKSSSDNYVFRVPLSVYNKKSEGKIRNRYYRPIDQRYPEVMLDNIDVVYKK